MYSSPAEPQGKPKHTGVGSLSLLQWVFTAQESNRGLLRCRRILYQLSYEGSPSPNPTKKEKTKHCLLGICGKVELNSWKVDLLGRKITSVPAVFSRIEFAEFMTFYRVTSYYWWAHKAPLSMGFPRQEYWSGLPFHSPGNPPDPGIEFMSPALADGFFTIEPPGSPRWTVLFCNPPKAIIEPGICTTRCKVVRKQNIHSSSK